MFSETTISRQTIFRGKVISVELQDVRLETGQTAYREIVRHHGAVGVLGQAADGRFVFVRQYRKPVEAIMTEVVAGLLDAGESPEDAARREMKEETGYDVDTLVQLGRFYASPGYVDEQITAFWATLHPDAGTREMDEDERVEVVHLTESEVEVMLSSGDFMDAKTVAMWGLYRLHDPGKARER